MRYARFSAILFAWGVLAECLFAGTVRAGSHEFLQQQVKGYWIWAGIKAPADLKEDKLLYIYQGLVRGDHAGVRYTRKGLYPFPLTAHPVYLVLRLEGRLPDPEALALLSESLAENWQKHGVHVTGIQLDFDSATSKLLQYGLFLRQIRGHLPHRYALSVTGLGDWVLSGDSRALREILEATEEVVFQLYQGRSPLADIQPYLAKLAGLKAPFKIGLLDRPENNKWVNILSENKQFQGVVIFLQR